MNNYNDFSRLATMEEVNNFHIVENALTSEELYTRAVDLASDCIFSYGTEHKKAYNRAYRFCKVHGFTVNALTEWYCIDAY
jgi:hypothetical protein